MPVSEKPIIVFDYETTGKDRNTCEITQIAAEMIHPRKLEVVGSFNMELSVLEPDKIEEDALKITGKTRESIAKGVRPNEAWPTFVNWVNGYNKSKNSWGAPIPAGYNILGYDIPITERYCQLYGPIDKKRNQQSLVSGYMAFDLLHHFFWFTESLNEPVDNKLPTLCEYMGLSTENAHDAQYDVSNCSKILIRLLLMYRKIAGTGKFKNSFGG